MNSWKPEGRRSPAWKSKQETLVAMVWLGLRPSGSDWKMGKLEMGRRMRELSPGSSLRLRREPGARTRAGPT